MARKANKKPNAKLARNYNLNLVGIITTGLSSIGRPIYLIFSYVLITVLLTLSLLGSLIRITAEKLIEFFFKLTASAKRRLKKIRKKLKKNKLKIPVFRFDFKNEEKILKLESLRINLLELKILILVKKLLRRNISRVQKIKLKRIAYVSIFLIPIIILALYFYFAIFKTLPAPGELSKKEPEVSTKIYDRHGTLLYKIYKDENRSIVPLTQIPIHVRLATLAAEDAEFYDNPGFSIKGMARAVIQNLRTGSLQGGSTITQQLVKNVLLSPEKTVNRKIKEIVLSVEVEANYTKDQILEMYLNQVSYGGTAYGVEEASQEFFGKNVQDLDLAQAAFLAGLPKSPTSYSPFGQSPELGLERQREVLHLMTINKFITAEQEDAASKEKLTFIYSKNHILAPHFVMYIRQLLVDKYGEDMVEKGGLEVTTSLDMPIQDMAQKVVSDEIQSLKPLNVGNGDALVVNPKTGEILAMVGSANYFDNNAGGQVNVTTRLRQPGSSIKVVNYTYALAHGYTPATMIDDSPITYVTPGSAPYSPVNYDGKFRGPITLRSALAQSRNIPAVKVLASYGVANMVQEGQEMGIESWTDPSKFGLSLTLGGGAVTSLDMARVFSTLANEGKTPDLMPILTVKDYKGRILESNSPKINQTVDPRVAFLMTSMLSDNNARAPEFGLNSYLVIPNHPEVAVKTGTSNDLRDNWTDGYNQNYLVITWVGNNNNAPMSHIASGVTGASPIWNKIMTALLQNTPATNWTPPTGVVKINCINGRNEWFMNENILPNFCSPQPTNTPKDQKNDQILNGASTSN